MENTEMSAQFLYKTKNNSSPERKPRVYFTCHPDDFYIYFEKVCEDIFKTHDCTIFYTKNMYDEIEEKYKESDLGSMHLFVIPVTFRLLYQPNRAMDSDIRYAKEKNIRILPIMMEPNLKMANDIYAQKDKFGELQYLNPYSKDCTAISYEEKLKKYLESVLISNKMIERIRKEFDAYIFLSYRKKDRHLANEFMELIHRYPEFRDIAIWYDEFLTPGESFRKNIEQTMQSSKLFTLLVTPSLLEYVNGQPNYVMKHEYPNAKTQKMTILPAEMEKTDKTELRAKYLDIPDCVNPKEEIFRKQFLDKLSAFIKSDNKNDPEHRFLIGLAYLEGIDVEINKERGIELITSAAKAGFTEATEKLFWIYMNGNNVQADYLKALQFAELLTQQTDRENKESLQKPQNQLALAISKAVKAKTEATTEKVYETLSKNYEDSLAQSQQQIIEVQKCILRCIVPPQKDFDLNSMYNSIFKQPKTLEIYEHLYNFHCEIFGEKDLGTMSTLYILAFLYKATNNYKRASELYKKLYIYRCEISGEKDDFTLSALSNLSETYIKLNQHSEALETFKKLYSLQCEILGEKNSLTLKTLSNIAETYENLGYYQKASETFEKVYTIQCEILGEEDEATLKTQILLASTYVFCKNYKKATEEFEKICTIRYKNFGEEDKLMLLILEMLYKVYTENLKNYKKALETAQKIYNIQCKIFGEETKETLEALHNIAKMYRELSEFKKAEETFEKYYIISCKISEKEPSKALNHLLSFYDESGYTEEISKEKIYHLLSQALGDDHPQTLYALYHLSLVYGTSGNPEKATELLEKIRDFCIRNFSKKPPFVLDMTNMLANAYKKLNNLQKLAEALENIYTLRAQITPEKLHLISDTLGQLAIVYEKIGDLQKTTETLEKRYALTCDAISEKQRILNNLAIFYTRLGNYHKLLEVRQKDYEITKQNDGEKSAKTHNALNNLADAYIKNENFQKALDLKTHVYFYRLRHLGESNPETLKTLTDLSNICQNLGYYEKAYENMENAYLLYRKFFGKNYLCTIQSKQALKELRKNRPSSKGIFKKKY